MWWDCNVKHLPGQDTLRCLGPCADFLYGFKAARRAARTAAAARSPSLPLTLPLRRRQRRATGAKSRKPGRLTYSKSHRCRRNVPAPAARIVRGRSEPVKAVCDRRATAPVELPGECTREDGLDRTCPDQELAAIGSRDTSGQESLTLKRQEVPRRGLIPLTSTLWCRTWRTEGHRDTAFYMPPRQVGHSRPLRDWVARPKMLASRKTVTRRRPQKTCNH